MSTTSMYVKCSKCGGYVKEDVVWDIDKWGICTWVPTGKVICEECIKKEEGFGGKLIGGSGEHK